MIYPYRAIYWTKRKFFVDLALAGGIFLYLALFVSISMLRVPRPDYPETGAILTRAFGTLAILLLHAVLAIGPLSRLNPAFMALIPHRRHLGVITFLVAAVHAALAVILRHTGGVLNPLASIVLGNGQWLSPREWPFELFGLAALLILAAQAVTSHDFWIAYLSPEGWKRLQMWGYAAYALAFLHAVLGVTRGAGSLVYTVLLGAGMFVLVALHRKAAAIERARDHAVAIPDSDGFVPVCAPEEIPMGRARVVMAGGERVAVFRHWQGISAISNVCAHQLGPLGEDGMSAGCVRCPWHDALYFPQNGLAPSPSAYRVPTFPVKLVDGCVYVSPLPNPPGFECPPLPVPGQREKRTPFAGQIQSQRGLISPRRRAAPAETEES